MKHLFFLFVFLLAPLFISAQVTSGQSNEDGQSVKETLSEENQQTVDSISDVIVEGAMMLIVDSLRDSGMYMSALKLVDHVMDSKREKGGNPTIRMYISKGQILMHFEEWESLIETCDECLLLYKNDTNVLVDLWLPFIYKMKGDGCKYAKVYKDAIVSYENALVYYLENKRVDNQADVYYCMAFCYDQLGKKTIASSFYDKGLEKYLEYFNVSRTGLLKSRIEETDDIRKPNLDLFSCYLYNMAVREQDMGNRRASQEYLLMSAHCGNEKAISEYNRIYRRY